MSQTFRDNILKISLLFFAGAFLLCASTHIDPQASLDASYYKILAQQLDAGKGFKEPFIWQHLNDYQHIEHEIDYWMPLGIIIYHIAFKIFGDSGGIGLNILIWAVLCVLVYSDVYKQTTSRFSALIAFITLLFGGRIIFFLLTTDNIAFYGLLGYLLFKTVDKIRFSWPAAGVISGIAALTRIDGLIITAISGILVYLRTRSLKTLLAFVAIVLLVVMPWMIRNKISTGIFWQSNYKAIFMTDYEDFFRPEFSGSLKNYFRQGLKTIIFQKFDGLKASFFDFFVIPAFFIFIPLWLAGLAKTWNSNGGDFALYLVIMWLFCGILFPFQAIKGTSMHISAFFFPYYSLLAGIGFSAFLEIMSKRKYVPKITGAFLIAWVLYFTSIAISNYNQKYQFSKDNMRNLFSSYMPAQNQTIASRNPVQVYEITGCSGVIWPKSSNDSPLRIAEKYNTDFIITESNGSFEVKSSVWQVVASSSPLLMLKRLKKNK